jgi:hypothetical protein
MVATLTPELFAKSAMVGRLAIGPHPRDENLSAIERQC